MMVISMLQRTGLGLLLVVLATICMVSAGLAEDSVTPEATSPGSTTDWTALDEDQPAIEIRDPLEPINRGIFWCNDKLYVYLFKPLARGYRVAVPRAGREAVGHAFANLGAPVSIVNALLQGKFARSFNQLERFMVNSTFGLGGLFDLYAADGPQLPSEDFGQTLGHYGLGSGFYLVLPVLGPSNLRDGVSRFADQLIEPLSSPYYMSIPRDHAWAAKVFDQINWLSLDRDSYEAIKAQALDPYLFVRNGFMQRRVAEVSR